MNEGRQELTTAAVDPVDIIRSWPDLLWQPIGSKIERDMIEGVADVVSRPATGQWLMARVASLLVDYYAPDVPASIISMAAADWADELDEFPEWAINRAVRFWKGAENPDRRKKPLPGDISARARLEMGPVIVARRALERFDQGKLPFIPPGQDQRKPTDPAERVRIAGEILKAANFHPKRMGGAE